MVGLTYNEILLVILIAGVCNGTVLIADMTMSKMVELTTRPPFCHVHHDRGTIQNMLLSSDPKRVRQMSDESIAQLVKICKNNEVTSSHQGGFIYPGTKWCGPGTVAQNYSDLGYHKKEDICCRAHDNCPNYLMEGECRQGICNDSPYTRSHCDCDATFRRCLQTVNTEIANTIGAIFFNIVQVICFQERTPCTQWQRIFDVVSSEYSATTQVVPVPVVNDCAIEFVKSGRYMAGYTSGRIDLNNGKEFFINRNGYTKAESDELCAQWKYRPSEKYVPLMPLSSHR